MRKIIIALLLALVICSCGARKVDKNKNSEAQEVEFTDNSIIQKKEESNLKITENTKVDDKNETLIKETVFEPVNPNNPSSVIDENGKETILKNAKKTTKETKQKNNTKTDNSKDSEQFNKSEVSEKIESAAKVDTKIASEEVKVDRAAWSLWSWLWLLIPIGLIVLVVKNRMKIVTWIEDIWWV